MLTIPAWKTIAKKGEISSEAVLHVVHNRRKSTDFRLKLIIGPSYRLYQSHERRCTRFIQFFALRCDDLEVDRSPREYGKCVISINQYRTRVAYEPTVRPRSPRVFKSLTVVIVMVAFSEDNKAFVFPSSILCREAAFDFKSGTIGKFSVMTIPNLVGG